MKNLHEYSQMIFFCSQNSSTQPESDDARLPAIWSKIAHKTEIIAQAGVARSLRIHDEKNIVDISNCIRSRLLSVRFSFRMRLMRNAFTFRANWSR